MTEKQLFFPRSDDSRIEKQDLCFRRAMNKIIIILYLSLCAACLNGQVNRPVFISGIEFKGDFNFSQRKLKSEFQIREQQIFDRQKLDKASGSLLNFLQREGYFLGRIDSIQTRFSTDSSRVDLIVFGRSGQRVYFGAIKIKADSLAAKTYEQKISISQGDYYLPSRFEEEINLLLQSLADEAFPFAQAEIEQVRFTNEGNKTMVDIDLRISEGARVAVSDIVISGNTYTRDEVVLRELNIRPGSLYSRSALEKIPQRLNRLEIFKPVKEPALIVTAEDSVAIKIEIEEGNSTSFDGVIGYIPDQTSAANKRGYFTGLINLSFRNLFGSARKFDVHWQKPDQLSEEFELFYTEPWLLGYPLDISLGLDRTVRDTTFVEWNGHLFSRLRLFGNLSILANLSRKTVYPDSSASRTLRLLRNEIINSEIGIEYDIRDNPINPRSGLIYRSTYSYGFKNNLGPEYLFLEDKVKKKYELQTIKLRFGWYYNLWSNQVFALEMNGMQIKSDRLQRSDYFWFGGSRTLRGYRENQFWGDIAAWANLEYRFILNRNSRLFLFSDWGLYHNPEQAESHRELLPGYGFGIRIDTPLGILGVDYGLGRGDGFAEGKIHFGIINRF